LPELQFDDFKGALESVGLAGIEDLRDDSRTQASDLPIALAKLCA
jgi:hypothetical protein